MSQGLRQASVRAVSGTTLTYEGDWHAMWDVQGIAAGTLNERMISYANTKLSATYTNVNDAMQALAVAGGATNFGSLGTYSFALGPVPVNSVAPTLSPTTAAIGVLITCGTGTWSNTPTSYAYQWMRGGVDIGSATASTYTTVGADDGTTLTCKVRASNANGPAAGYTTTSNSCAISSATYLIDTMTQAAARAFSTRKLRSAHAGSAVRVRRSSDNAEQDIGFSGEDLDTSALTTFVGAGTGYIVRWYDQSSTGDNAVNVTAAEQARIVISGTVQTRNSKACIETIQLGGLTSSTVGVYKEATSVASYSAAAYTNYSGLLRAGAGGPFMVGHSGANYYYDNPPMTYYIDNVLTASRVTPMSNTLYHARATTTGSSTSSTVQLYENAGSSFSWSGSVCELMVWTSQLSAGDITTVYTNQKAYWGTP